SAWRRVQVLGENLGIAPKPIGFRFGDEGLEFGPAPVKPRKPTEKDEAVDWLRQHMEPGQAYKASDLLEEAEQCGLAERTVRKAATEKLGIKPKRVRKGNRIEGWEWVLPSPIPGERNT